MVAIESTETLYLALGFVVPGLVIFYVRSMFITGRRPTHSENVLTYLVLSAVYYALTIHFIEKILAVEEPWTARAAIWVVLTIVGPALLGLLLGMSTQRQYAKRIADRLNLTLVHVIPAAWDWRFSSLPRGGLFVMVTLKGDQTVAGFFGRNSFASSDTGERDIYIEEEYDVAETGEWMPRSAQVGIFIPASEIRYIEFWERR